jgi:hypothetical protein
MRKRVSRMRPPSWPDASRGDHDDRGPDGDRSRRYIPRIQRINAQVDINIVVATGIYTYHEAARTRRRRGPDLGDVGPQPRPLNHRRPGVSPTAVIEIPRTHNPYPRQGVQADDHGIPRYAELPESLIAMLARHVETGPDVEAVVEVGGQRLAYRQLWVRAARVGGACARPAWRAATGSPCAIRPG